MRNAGLELKVLRVWGFRTLEVSGFALRTLL